MGVKRAAKWAGIILVAIVAIIGAGCGILTGPRNVDAYPEAAESPYKLPWPAGITRFCIQGNRAVVSHRGWEEYAFDFVMPVGSDVCAARAGEVVRVVVEHDGHGYKWPNNRITIQHQDGTLGEYLHIKKDGNLVNVGDRVEQGQVICASGHVGNSAMPHLHFHVTSADRSTTLPITFADVDQHEGLPRMMHYYTSGNTVPPKK
jgi:murein DD-endopeptidase MepM/ murein hydrolase activator NlpD